MRLSVAEIAALYNGGKTAILEAIRAGELPVAATSASRTQYLETDDPTVAAWIRSHGGVVPTKHPKQGLDLEKLRKL
jgi:hypothetical protein